MDKHTPEQRRKNMQAVKNKDTKIEIMLRKALFAKGYRYRKNSSKIFGKPDIVFVTEQIAVFCDSEFWHGFNWETRKHDFKSNKTFWISKIERNIERDKDVNRRLRDEGYIVLRFWGSQIKKELNSVVDIIEQEIINRREK